MGNSRVYRVGPASGDDDVLALARRLLRRTSIGCCPREVEAEITLGLQDGLARYLGIGRVHLSLAVPAAYADQVGRLLTPLVAADDLNRRAGGGYEVQTTLTPELVAVLPELPPMPVSLCTDVRPLADDSGSPLVDALLARVGADRATITWWVCWDALHNHAGLQLGLNGVPLWHPTTPPGHSLYVHAHADQQDELRRVVVDAGGELIGESALGW